MKDFALLVIIAGAWGILSVVSEKSDQHESHEKFTDVDLTDELLNVVVKGLWLVKYLPEGIQVIEAKSQNNFFRIYFVNPSFHNQSCFFQFAYCHFCSNQVKPYVPACSSPCPGKICKVDKRLGHLEDHKSSRKNPDPTVPPKKENTSKPKNPSNKNKSQIKKKFQNEQKWSHSVNKTHHITEIKHKRTRKSKSKPHLTTVHVK